MTSKPSNVVLLTNIPSPYNVDLFWNLQNGTDRYTFFPVYTNASEDNRSWTPKEERMINTTILNSRVLKIPTAHDYRYIHFSPSIKPTLDHIQPKAVIAWEYNPAALMALAWCQKHHVRFIHVTEGTLNSERSLNPVQTWSRKRIISNADAFIACSSKAKEKLLFWGAEEEKIETALLTVDITPYLSIHRSPLGGRILYVGSLAERKGVDLLIQSLPFVQKPFSLHIVGDKEGKEKEELKRLITSLHLEDSVTWCGYLEGESLRREYQEASVFVLPTKEDCFGLVLVEAMAAGVPIVSSKYADGAYDVINEKNGSIVDPYDKHRMAEAITFYLNHPYHSDNSLIEKFSYSEITAHYYVALDQWFNRL